MNEGHGCLTENITLLRLSLSENDHESLLTSHVLCPEERCHTNKETNKQTIICITHSILWINVLPGVPTMVAAVFVVVEVILVYKKTLFFLV